MKNKLLIVISTDNADSIMRFPLLYGGVSLSRGYWEKVHVMFWGASITRVMDNQTIRDKVVSMQKEDVEFSSCIVCAQDYGAVELLEGIGIICNHTGELMTEALKSEEWSVLTV